MWWQRKLLVVFLFVLILTGCGFTPVYEQQGVNHTTNTALPAIAVKSIEGGRSGQELKTHLEDQLDPAATSSGKSYHLNVRLNREIIPLVIEQDRTINRYNLVITANYNLKNKATGKSIHTGKSRMVGSYDAVESDFATYAAQRDTESRIMKELARDIKVRLTAYFLGKQG